MPWTCTSAASSTRSCICSISRFWAKVSRDLGLVKFNEPAANLLTQGMVLNGTYYSEDAAGKRTWYNPLDVNATPGGATLRATGEPVVVGGIEKMSKSKNNGVDRNR